MSESRSPSVLELHAPTDDTPADEITWAGRPWSAAPVPASMQWLARTARRQRVCLVLAARLEMDEREIAAALDLHPQAVARLLNSAIEELSCSPRQEADARPLCPPGVAPGSSSIAVPPSARAVGWYRDVTKPRQHQYWDGEGWIMWSAEESAEPGSRWATPLFDALLASR